MKKYVIGSTLVTLVILISFFLYLINYHYYLIEGTSMEPTIKDGSHVWIKKKSHVNRYDIVDFSLPNEEEKLIKRVIGMPGDSLFIQGNRLVIDQGKDGNFTHTVGMTISSDLSQKWQSLTKIPKGSYFVVGDNLDVSKDSRTLGWIPKEQIEGVAIYYISAK